jgi:hypothetical protein
MMTLIIDPAGRARCLYAEAIDLRSLGELSIARASRIEPDDLGHWWADLSPATGPVLGPFGLRSEALAAEFDWLSDHLASLAAAPRPIPHITTPS